MNKEREAFKAWFKKEYLGIDNLANQGDDGAMTRRDYAYVGWQAAKAQVVPELISVKDKLPPANMLVLGMSQTHSNIFNVYNVMALDEFKEFEVTHWMPLPDAPQEPAND